jgi:hypothetical protein
MNGLFGRRGLGGPHSFGCGFAALRSSRLSLDAIVFTMRAMQQSVSIRVHPSFAPLLWRTGPWFMTFLVSLLVSCSLTLHAKLAVESERQWLVEHFDKELARILSERPQRADNAQGMIAWGYAYTLEALAEMVQATREPRYAEQFVRVADEVIATRDDKHNRRDEIRGKALPAWGSVKYSNDKHYVWAVHTGMIVAPMAQFAAVVKRDNKLRARFGKDAERMLQAATEAMAIHESEYRDGPAPAEGYLYCPRLKSHLPLNQLLTPGRAWLWLYAATGETRYRQFVERLLQFTLNRVRRLPDGAMVWGYWPGLDGPGDKFDDNSHGAITADFLAQCIEHGLAPAELLDALDNTFLTRVLLGPDTVADFLSGKGANNYRYAPYHWARLARHNPIIRAQLLEFIRRRPSGCEDGVYIQGPLVGYAQLVAATPVEHYAQGKARLLGHWPLAGDCKDKSGNRNHGVNHGVNLRAQDPDGESKSVAAFDGRGAFIEVRPGKSLKLGTNDFTVSVWVHTDRELDDVLGDVLSFYDPAARKGFNLGFMNYAGVTTAQSNFRNVSFGIDNAQLDAKWTDCGRPGNNLFVFALTVHDGDLYAGTFETGTNEAGHVWRYDGGTQWTDLGSPDRANSVICLASFKGALYAGTGRYRAQGSALPESLNQTPGGRVFRYADTNGWVDCGRLENPKTGAAVNLHSLAEFNGKLYASTLNAEGFGLYEYAGGKKWTYRGNPGRRVETLTVHNGHLYTSSYDLGGIVSRFSPGGKWEDLPPIPGVTQTYGFIVYDGGLHVTTWPTGSVFRLGSDDEWIASGRLGDQTEVMGVSVYNGKLYGGTLPLGQVYRYEGGTAWTDIGRLDWTPDVVFRRVWSMAVYQGRLYCGTLPSGHVYSIEAGKCATYDHALKPCWRLLAGVRRGNRLELYVDGELMAISSALDPAAFDISTDKPLRIGFGTHDYFHGLMRDVRLYDRALDPAVLRSASQSVRPANPTPAR